MSEKMTLYKIGAEMEELFQLLVMDEEDQAEFDEKWSALQVQLSDKLVACRHMIRMWDAMIKAIKEEEVRLRERRKVIENAKTKVYGRVRGVMEVAEETKFLDKRLGLGFRLQKNPPSIEIEDEDLLEKEHPEFINVEVISTPDKKAIMEYIRTTGDVPAGVKYITDKKHLRTI